MARKLLVLFVTLRVRAGLSTMLFRPRHLDGKMAKRLNGGVWKYIYGRSPALSAAIFCIVFVHCLVLVRPPHQPKIVVFTKRTFKEQGVRPAARTVALPALLRPAIGRPQRDPSGRFRRGFFRLGGRFVGLGFGFVVAFQRFFN